MRPLAFLYQAGFLCLTLLCSSLVWAETTKCPAGIGASEGDKPKISIDAGHGFKIIACGNQVEAIGQKLHLTEFDLYSVHEKKKAKKIFTASALSHILISLKKKSMKLEELVWMSGKWTPVFQRWVTCKQRCTLSDERCMFKAKKSLNLAPLKDFREYETGKNKGEVPEDSLIAKLGELALYGNHEAQKRFLAPVAPVSLDGSSGEEFSAMRDLLKRMKKMGCL